MWRANTVRPYRVVIISYQPVGETCGLPFYAAGASPRPTEGYNSGTKHIFPIVGEGFPLPHYNVWTGVPDCPIMVFAKTCVLF